MIPQLPPNGPRDISLGGSDPPPDFLDQTCPTCGVRLVPEAIRRAMWNGVSLDQVFHDQQQLDSGDATGVP